MSRNTTLVKNTLIIAIGKISTQFLTFLLLPLYTAYLSVAEFGTVDLALTYVALLVPLAMLSLEMGVFRFLIDARKNEGEKKQIITNALHIVVLGALVAIALYLTVSTFITIPHGGYIISAIIAMIFSNFFLQIARGFGNNLQFAIGGIVTGLATIAANITFIVFMGMGADGMLLAVALANAIGALYLIAALRLHKYIGIGAGDRTLKKQLLRYSTPLIPNGISWWVINAADRTIITIILGVAANGIYAVAYKFPLIFSGLFSFFGMSWTESASVHINSPDRDKFFSQTMNASIKLFGAFGALIIAGVPFIFGLFVNQEFAEAYMYIPILIIGAFFNSIVGLYSAIYIAKKLTKQVMTTSIMAAVINISFTLVFIHFIGIYAAAIAMGVAFLSMAIFRHYDMKKYVNITYERGIFWKLGLLYVIAATGYYMSDIWTVLAGGLLVAAGSIRINQGIGRVLIQKVFKKSSANIN
ncbi:oligosaccharide flippase family protein [Candidatus Saccharibacteria bacterium TM7i]|nr:oligosaccharide flippase family protein [Candidatus Saccharibacteria bacterium TM7i]